MLTPAVILAMKDFCANAMNSKLNSSPQFSTFIANVTKLDASTANCSSKGQIHLHELGESLQPNYRHKS